MTTYISLATSATMFPNNGPILTSTLTPEMVQRRLAHPGLIVSALNNDHKATIDAIWRRYGLELPLSIPGPDGRAPKVALHPGDELFIVQATLPRLAHGEIHSNETVASAPISFLRWRVPLHITAPAPANLPQSIYSQIIDHAHSIALWQRGEARLKTARLLYNDFEAENAEFDDAYDAWQAVDFEEDGIEEADVLLEWADVAYKLICVCYQTRNDEQTWTLTSLPPRTRKIDFNKGIDALLLKYGRRAAGYPKDVEAERQLLLKK